MEDRSGENDAEASAVQRLNMPCGIVQSDGAEKPVIPLQSSNW